MSSSPHFEWAPFMYYCFANILFTNADNYWLVVIFSTVVNKLLATKTHVCHLSHCSQHRWYKNNNDARVTISPGWYRGRQFTNNNDACIKISISMKDGVTYILQKRAQRQTSLLASFRQYLPRKAPNRPIMPPSKTPPITSRFSSRIPSRTKQLVQINYKQEAGSDKLPRRKMIES